MHPDILIVRFKVPVGNGLQLSAKFETKTLELKYEMTDGELALSPLSGNRAGLMNLFMGGLRHLY